MKLSNQALGAIMMALQKSLLEQSDIVPTLKNFNFQLGDEKELVVDNPPSFKVNKNKRKTKDSNEETIKTVGSD
jgi:hypothetical protein